MVQKSHGHLSPHIFLGQLTLEVGKRLPVVLHRIPRAEVRHFLPRSLMTVPVGPGIGIFCCLSLLLAAVGYLEPVPVLAAGALIDICAQYFLVYRELDSCFFLNHLLS